MANRTEHGSGQDPYYGVLGYLSEDARAALLKYLPYMAERVNDEVTRFGEQLERVLRAGVEEQKKRASERLDRAREGAGQFKRIAEEGKTCLGDLARPIERVARAARAVDRMAGQGATLLWRARAFAEHAARHPVRRAPARLRPAVDDISRAYRAWRAEVARVDEAIAQDATKERSEDDLGDEELGEIERLIDRLKRRTSSLGASTPAQDGASPPLGDGDARADDDRAPSQSAAEVEAQERTAKAEAAAGDAAKVEAEANATKEQAVTSADARAEVAARAEAAASSAAAEKEATAKRRAEKEAEANAAAEAAATARAAQTEADAGAAQAEADARDAAEAATAARAAQAEAAARAAQAEAAARDAAEAAAAASTAQADMDASAAADAEEETASSAATEAARADAEAAEALERAAAEKEAAERAAAEKAEVAKSARAEANAAATTTATATETAKTLASAAAAAVKAAERAAAEASMAARAATAARETASTAAEAAEKASTEAEAAARTRATAEMEAANAAAAELAELIWSLPVPLQQAQHQRTSALARAARELQQESASAVKTIAEWPSKVQRLVDCATDIDEAASALPNEIGNALEACIQGVGLDVRGGGGAGLG